MALARGHRRKKFDDALLGWQLPFEELAHEGLLDEHIGEDREHEEDDPLDPFMAG